VFCVVCIRVARISVVLVCVYCVEFICVVVGSVCVGGGGFDDHQCEYYELCKHNNTIFEFGPNKRVSLFLFVATCLNQA
jgi:hypothetical protein